VFADPSPANAGQQARAIALGERFGFSSDYRNARARARPRGVKGAEGEEEERWAPVIDAVVFA